MDKQYLKRVALYFVSAVLSIFLILYIGYHMYISFGSSVETLTASMSTEREKITVEAYILRDETVLYASQSGSVHYQHADGVRLPAGSKIADIYAGADIRDSVLDIDARIHILQNSGDGSLAHADTATADTRIQALYLLIRQKIEANDYEYALTKGNDLLTWLNKRQVITKTVDGYGDPISALQSQKDALIASEAEVLETLHTTSSGYFYTEVDGYENIFSAADIDLLTISRFHEMLAKDPDEEILSDQGALAVGKIATGFSWYLACEVPLERANALTVGRSYHVIFPYSGDAELPMRLYRAVSEPDNDYALLIFECSTIPENFNFLRAQTVEIVYQSYSGYRVPVSAVRIVDGVEGVYILDGSVVKFRTISFLFEDNGYFIVEPKDYSDEAQYNRLGLYDQIIIKGKNLYDGKIIT